MNDVLKRNNVFVVKSLNFPLNSCSLLPNFRYLGRMLKLICINGLALVCDTTGIPHKNHAKSDQFQIKLQKSIKQLFQKEIVFRFQIAEG